MFIYISNNWRWPSPKDSKLYGTTKAFVIYLQLLVGAYPYFLDLG
jgi:hypothetical protein